MNIKDVVAKAVFEYCEALKARCGDQIEQIILFGSQARGEATAESDIDILVVVNWEAERLPNGFYAIASGDPRWQQIVDTAYDVSLEYDVYISPLVMNKQEFQSWSPLINRIKREGSELWTKSVN